MANVPEERTREVGNALLQAALIAGSEQELGPALDAMLYYLGRAVPYDVASLVLSGNRAPWRVARPSGVFLDEILRCHDGQKLAEMERTRQTVVANDVSLNVPGPLGADLGPICAWIATPLLARGRVIGRLYVGAAAPACYTDEDVQLLVAFANQAAALIQNSPPLEWEPQPAAYLRLVAEISQRVLSILDPETLLDYATKAIQSECGYYYVDAFLLEPGEEVLAFQSSSHTEYARLWRERGLSFHLGEGIIGHVAATGQPYVSNDVLHDPIYIPDELLPATRSELAVPIRVGHRILGVLDVNSEAPGAFGEQDVFVTQSLADQLALGLENARLFSAEARRREEAERLQAATQALSSTLDLQEVFELILRELRQVVPYDSASVQELKGDTLEIIGGDGFPNLEELLGLRFDVTAGDNPNRDVLRLRAPIIIDDAPAAYQGFRLEPHAPAAIRSWLGVPLLFGDQLIGMVALDKHEPQFYNQAHARLAMAFAAQAAVAIQNARLFTSERESRLELVNLYRQAEHNAAELARRAESLSLVNRISTAVNSSLDLDQILHTAVEEMARAFDVPQAGIILFDPEKGYGTVVAEYQTHPDDSARAVRIPLKGNPLLDGVLTTQRGVAVTDAATDPLTAGIRDVVRVRNIRSLLVVPLLAKGTVIGTIGLDAIDTPRTFTADEIGLAETIANQVGLAVENARLFEAEREQRNLTEALREATAAMSSTLDLDQVLDRILEQVNHVIPGDSANIALIEDGCTRIVRSRGYERFGVADAISSVSLSVVEVPTLRYMLETNAPIVVADTPTYPGWVSRPETMWLRSYAGAPIRVRDQVLGFLSVDSATPGFFSQSDANRLQAFAAQAAVAIENANLYREVSHHLEQVLVLNQVAQAASSTLDLDELLRRSLDALLKIPQFERAHVLLLDETAMELWLHPALIPRHLPAEQRQMRIPLGTGICGYVASTGKPLRVPDVRRDPRYATGFEDTLSELCVPLRVGDRTIGVLDAQSAHLNAYTEEDERFLVTLAGQLSTILDNARLFNETKQRVRELTALMQVSQALNQARDLQTILNIVLEEAFALLDSQEGSMLLVEPPGGNRLRMVAERGLGPDVMAEFNARPVYTHEGTYRRALETGRIVEVPDTSQDPDFLHDVGSRAKSVTNVPLIAEHRPIGLIAVDGLPRDETARGLLMALADMAAVAIDKERLHQETADRLAEVSTLYTLATQITGSLSLNRVLESVVTILKLTMNCRACCIFLLDPTGTELRLEAGTGLSEEQRASARLSPTKGIGSEVLNERRYVYIPDTQLVPDVGYIDPEARSVLAVPLIVRNQAIGVLSLDDVISHAFGDEGRLLTIAAAQAAVAIENAQLYESLQSSYRRLEQAYDALSELDRMKSELVQNISHELRTPLTFIKGYVELLQDGDMGDLTPQQKMALDIVASKAGVLSRLVDDIITLQHSGRQQFHFKLISLANVGHAAIQGARASCAALGIRLCDEIAPNLPPVHGDEQRLGQVFDNLLSNALKFSEPGTCITVRMWEMGEWLCTEVEDQGIGIPADKAIHVFERFYQVDGSTSRRFGGTGLGLAIVKQIIEAHGGKVGVRTEENKGSCFYFTLPKADTVLLDAL